MDARFDRHYQSGDRLTSGYEAELPRPSDSVLTLPDLCEQLFGIHNRDDRPDGKTAPSLSVGDVIVLRGLDNGYAYSVARAGFVKVDLLNVEADQTGNSYLEFLDSQRSVE